MMARRRAGLGAEGPLKVLCGAGRMFGQRLAGALRVMPHSQAYGAALVLVFDWKRQSRLCACSEAVARCCAQPRTALLPAPSGTNGTSAPKWWTLRCASLWDFPGRLWRMQTNLEKESAADAAICWDHSEGWVPLASPLHFFLFLAVTSCTSFRLSEAPAAVTDGLADDRLDETRLTSRYTERVVWEWELRCVLQKGSE